MPDIFISYKKEDGARVEPVARGLAEAGYDVWWDHRIPPGRSYREVIGEALQKAKCIIVVWSELSVEAQWVLDEADEGKRRNVLLPIVIDPVEIPYGFRQIEAATLTGWNGDRFHPEWLAALETISHFVGRAPGGPAVPFVTPSAAVGTQPAAGPPPVEVADTPKAAPHFQVGQSAMAALLVLAVVAAGMFYGWQSGMFGASRIADADPGASTFGLAAVAMPLDIRVDSERGFWRSPDGSWLEYAGEFGQHAFVEESAEADMPVIYDSSRDIRLLIDISGVSVMLQDGNQWTPLYDIVHVERAVASPSAPAQAALAAHFDGGAFMRVNGLTWIDAAGGSWVESERNPTTITLKDATQQSWVQLAFGEGQIWVHPPEAKDWTLHATITAVDYAQ